MATISEHGNKLKISILSLSLLTVMAGAAVAPALNIILDYFDSQNPVLVQMIISIPAIFIILTNMLVPRLLKRYRTKKLILCGLAMYVVGGCMAGCFSNIYIILAERAVVGIGVGIIMPLSTGLISYYYTRDKQDKMMGYSSAMNQLGGSLATLFAGLLAALNWRLSFLVYLIGLSSTVLIFCYLPDNNISSNNDRKDKMGYISVLNQYYPHIIAMFLLMFVFFIYPSCFAIEMTARASISQGAIPVVMALMDIFGFGGGLLYSRIRRKMGIHAKFVSPILFFIGYMTLGQSASLMGAVFGSMIIGLAAGVGVPFIISTASQAAGRKAAFTVMPMLSVAMYLSQFVTPITISVIEDGLRTINLNSSPFYIAAVTSLLFFLWSITIKPDISHESIRQEEIGL